MLLPEPTTVSGRSALADVIAEPARALIAVDYDGTLAPIVERPENARPAPGAVQCLAALADRVGAVAVVSGRAALDAVALGGLDGVPRLQVLGHYGLERWADGRLEAPGPAASVALARQRLAELLLDAPAGVHLEDKHHSLVVHTRPAGDPAGALVALTAPVGRLAAELGLEVVPGRMVLEVRPPGVDKGTALRALVAERDSHAVVYIGDDVGDVPAFAVVDELRHSGLAGLKIASVDPALDDAPRELAAAADLILAGPADVVTFLFELAAAIGEV
ncbi:MAG: trehalose 6-phosphate phosphatase [Frankiaceae bacterium]|nr:trehalose 6-phosphate phosphatase [Frankiaceae bacterium]